MSVRPVMSCESCRDLLIELVCDELPADTAAEARAHAASCERCGPALAKLERTLTVASELPLLSPSPEVEKRIMQAARVAIAGKAKGPVREQVAPDSGVAGWFARISAWAMSPQVAMASVLLLVVGIGLYALPIGQSPETTALRSADEEGERSPEPAAAPSGAAAAVPMPLPDEEDARRNRQGAELLSRAPAPQYEPSAAKKAVRPALKPKAMSKGEAEALDDYGSMAPAKQQRAEAKRENAFEPSLEGLGASGAASGGGGFAQPPPAPSAPSPPKSARVAEPESARKDARDSAPSAGAAADRASEERPMEKLSALAQGIAASQRGDQSRAQQLLAPLLKSSEASERNQAHLWTARSLRAQNDCPAALVHYRQLTQSLSVAREVLQEAADCYERTGNEAQASKLRARAQSPAGKQ